jgi:hypothetical protein
MNIAIIEAFIALKEYAFNFKDLSEKLSELVSKYNKQFKNIFEAINFLLQNDKKKIERNERSNIGYKTKDSVLIPM